MRTGEWRVWQAGGAGGQEEQGSTRGRGVGKVQQ